MPATYNGVGTRYVGKANVATRPAACPHCRRSVNLVSYDTRLWFVVLFVPIIPLARKRIIDMCPSCRRHYVMPLDQWEAGKQLSISGAMDEFRRDPTPEKAVAAHRQLLSYHQAAQADEFGQTMAARYADNASVLLYLGNASSHVGRQAKATEFFEKALALRPDLPEARIAVADGYRRQGRLDEARALLDFLEAPGAARVHSAAPLELLANAYQHAGRHQEALDLYALVLREVPEAGQHRGFRQRMRASEKALKREASGLPPRKWTFGRLFGREAGPLRWLTVGGTALVLAALGLGGSNFYIKGHRKLYLVNGYGEPAQVAIAGHEAVTVPPHGERVVVLPEGRYRATVSGPASGEVACEIASDFFGRWFDRPAWVLNVGGEAVLITERVLYAVGGGSLLNVAFRTGQPFEHFTDINHPFEELPEHIQLEKGQQTTTRTQLDYLRIDTATFVQRLASGGRAPAALELAEIRLKARPNESDLVTAYVRAAQSAGQAARARSFLAATPATSP